ncbi:MAG: ester cyclase [Trueperaceae bacterium]
MTIRHPRETAIAIFEDGWNRGAFDGLEDAFAPTFVFHVHGTARDMRLGDLRRIVASWREGFPDLRFALHDVLSDALGDGDRVAIRATLTGTHRGEWNGRPASGRAIAVDHAFWLRFDAGRVVEVWEVLDSALLRRQMDGEA